MKGFLAISLAMVSGLALGQDAETVAEVGKLAAFFAAAPPWIFAITSVVTACTAVTALTPTKTDDKVLNVILKVLNIIAGNVGMNTNRDA